MAKNLHQTKNSNVTHACKVPVGTKSGDVVTLGRLTAWALTDRATAETIANGTAAHNLAEGEATCELAGVGTVLRLSANSAGDAFTDFSYNGKVVGVTLNSFQAGDDVPVALLSLGAAGAGQAGGGTGTTGGTTGSTGGTTTPPAGSDPTNL